MADILIQKDASTLVPKLGISADQRTAWAVDYTIYDINADGTKGAAYGPTRVATNRAGDVSVDKYGTPKLGPTGDSIPSLVSGGRITAKNNAVLLGDSRLAYGQVEGASSAFMHSASQILWMNDLLAVNNLPFDVTGNYTLGGEYIEQCVSSGRLASALAHPAETAIVLLGQGNWNTGLPNSDNAEVLLALLNTAIVAPLAAAKKLVLLHSFTPVSQSGTTTTAPRAATAKAVNAGIKAIAKKYSNVLFCDIYTPTLDPTSYVLNPLANCMRTVDGVHWVTNGAAKTGISLADQISDKIALTPWATQGTNALPAWSGSLTGGTNSGTFTSSGSLPPGWEVFQQTGSGTGASVTITDGGFGYKRIVIAAGSVDATFLLRPDSATRTSLAASFALGDVIQASMLYQVFAATDVQGVYATSRVNGSNSYVSAAGNNNSTQEPIAEVVFADRMVGGRRVTRPLAIVVAPTSMEMYVGIQLKATTGTITLDIADPRLYKMTAV